MPGRAGSRVLLESIEALNGEKINESEEIDAERNGELESDIYLGDGGKERRVRNVVFREATWLTRSGGIPRLSTDPGRFVKMKSRGRRRANAHARGERGLMTDTR